MLSITPTNIITNVMVGKLEEQTWTAVLDCVWITNEIIERETSHFIFLVFVCLAWFLHQEQQKNSKQNNKHVRHFLFYDIIHVIHTHNVSHKCKMQINCILGLSLILIKHGSCMKIRLNPEIITINMKTFSSVQDQFKYMFLKKRFVG